MLKFQSLTFWKKPFFILLLILSAFFLKGVFLAALTPIFVGQDESRHYSSIQYLAEPRPITWPLIEREETEGGVQNYNYSQEVKKTFEAINFEKSNEAIYSTFNFIQGYEGKNETLVNNNDWHKYNEYTKPNTAGNSFYHRLVSNLIERPFGEQNLPVRYFLSRIFSVLLGTIVILSAYLIAKNIGFSAKNSLLLTAIVAFQPRFSIYYAGINYDALLILTFALFTLGGVLALKQELNWKNFSLMAISIYIGTLAKPTAYILLAPFSLLIAFFCYEKIKNKNRYVKYASFLLLVCMATVLFIFIKNRFVGNVHGFGNTMISITNYLSESLTMGRFALSSRTYWGALTWTNSWFMNNLTIFIWFFQSIAATGIAWFLFSKKKPEFLPEKKYAIFLLVMIVFLQLGIRAADWSIFKDSGKLYLGTPGRYFLPNLTAHIILVFTGLGMLLQKNKYFERSLIVGLILMMSFMFYIVFNMIIFRYYL